MDNQVETIYQYVKRKLEENRGQFKKIAMAVDLPYFVVRSIHNGETSNPGVHNIQKLHDYFRKAGE
jgi:lysozyme family protein